MRLCRPAWIGTVLVIWLWTPAGVSADSINEKIDRERRRWNSSKTRSKKKTTGRRGGEKAGVHSSGHSNAG